jgi:hypothetical protein
MMVAAAVAPASLGGKWSVEPNIHNSGEWRI